jgi:hypothetical protein
MMTMTAMTTKTTIIVAIAIAFYVAIELPSLLALPLPSLPSLSPLPLPSAYYPFGGKPPKARQPFLWIYQPTNIHQPTTNDQPTAVELKFNHYRA